MTAHDIIKTALAAEYVAIEEDEDAVQYSIEILNQLIAECYGAEQNSREQNGQELLTEIPHIESTEDNIPYNDMLCRWALPYGIEWKFAEQNLDQYRADQYKKMYDDARQVAGGGVWL